MAVSLFVTEGIGPTPLRGEALGVLNGSVTRSLDGLDTATVSIKWPAPVALQLRTTVRLTDARGIVSDWRIGGLTPPSTPKGAATLQLATPLHDLGTSGLVRKVIGGRNTTSFAVTLPLSQIVRDYVLSDLPLPLSQWLLATLGTLDSDPVLTVSWSQWTRLQLLRACESLSRQELVLTRQSTGMHQLSFVTERGSAVPSVVLNTTRNVVQQRQSAEDRAVVSVVIPFGDTLNEAAGPSTAEENAWRVTEVLLDGWVKLRSGDGLLTPVSFVDQYLDHGAGWMTPAGAWQSATIIGSDPVAGAVRLSTIANLAVGARLTIFADAGGTPLLELVNRPLLNTDVGRVEATLTVPGGRSERNYIANPALANSSEGVTVGDHGVIMARAQFGVTRSGLVNGARAANTPTSTPLALDGLPNNVPIYPGHRITVNGVTLTPNADVIPAADGSLAIPVTPTVPATLPDDFPVTLHRKWRRTFTVSGTQNIMSRGLKLAAGGNDDGLPIFQWADQNAALAFRLTTDSAGRGATIRVGGALATHWNLGAGIVPFDAGSGAIRLVGIFTSGAPSALLYPEALPGTYNTLIVTAVASNSGGFDIVLTAADGQAASLAAMVPGTTTFNLSGYAFVLDSIVGNTVRLQHDDSTLLPGESGFGYIAFPTAGAVWSNVTIANGTTVTIDEVRESRTVRLNGVHATGAATLNIKPATELARRNVASGDVVYIPRPLTATLRITSASATQITELDVNGQEVTYWKTTLVCDLGASTLDEIAGSEWHNRLVFLQLVGVGSTLVRLTPFYDTNKMDLIDYNGPALDTGLLPATFDVVLDTLDSYTVASNATWNANGKVTVSVTVPSGRTIPARTRVWTNFHGNQTASMLRTTAQVVGPASSIELEGFDALHYPSGVTPPSDFFDIAPTTGGHALYRIKGGSAAAYQSQLPVIAGEVLYAAQGTSTNGSGQASVVLRSPNLTAIADNVPVALDMRAINAPGESLTGNAVRLLGPTWATGANPWTRVAGLYVPFPPGVTARLIRVSVWFVVNFDNGNQPLANPLQVAVMNNAGSVLGTGSVSEVYGTGMPQLIRITTSVSVTAPGRYQIGVQGGAFLNSDMFAAVRFQLWADGAEDAPYITEPGANALILAANNELTLRAIERGNIVCDVATLRTLTGSEPSVAQLEPGASYRFTDATVRLFRVTTDIYNPRMATLELESLQRTIARLIGTGRSTSAVSTGSGSVGGGVVAPSLPGSTVGLTVNDAAGNSVTDVRTLAVQGATVSASGANRATLSITQERDVFALNCVLDGGAWVVRDLAPLSYEVTITSGRGLIDGEVVTWAQTTLTCPAVNGLIYVDASGTVRARPAGIPELLPTTTAELLLWRSFVDIAVYGARVYSMVDARTYQRLTPRAPLYLRERVEAAKITSGAWSGATAINDIGYINWYFANLGLYPFVEELPTQVLDHLNKQISAFAGGSGTGATDWTTIHGTTHTDQFKWWYDVNDPRGTPAKRRADSHDSYCATFLRLAVRYARTVAGGLTWWDTNIAAIQDAIYYNHLLRQRVINGGAGYFNETFQDPAVYPFCQTLDNIEVYRGLKDAFDLMTDRGGAQATYAATYGGTATNILAGIQSMWTSTPNSRGDVDWMSKAWDNAAGVKLTNDMLTYYPDLVIGIPAAVFNVPLHGTPSIALERLTKLFAHLNAKAPGWFQSRQYDLYPWGMVAAAAARVGYRDIAEAWLSFVQRHHANDGVGYLLVHDLGWARYIERILNGEVL